MKTLEQNGYCNVAGLRRYFAIEVEDYDVKEKMLCKVFSQSRVGTSELYALEAPLIKEMLSAFAGTVVYSLDERVDAPQENKEATETSVFDITDVTALADMCAEDEFGASVVQKKGRKQSKKALTFEMLGIPVGTKLTYIEDESITVSTVDNKNNVKYKGVTTSITGMVKYFKQLSGTMRQSKSYNGYRYFTYNGEILTDLREAQERLIGVE